MDQGRLHRPRSRTARGDINMPRFAATILPGAIASLGFLSSAADLHAQQKPAETDSLMPSPRSVSACAACVDNREISGAVTLVATPDRIVHLDAIGRADIERRQADAARRHLLDRLDDQAHHGHGCHDAPGRGQAFGRRPGREVPAGIQGPQDRGRQAGAGHDPPPAHAHLGHGRSIPRRSPRQDRLAGLIPLYVAKPVSSSRARNGPTASPGSTPPRGSSRSSRACRSTGSSSGGSSARWG